MKVAAFLSHPIQHLTPLWQALSRMPDVTLKVFYYSKFGVEASFDRDFGVKMAWDVDLLAGHDHEFLPRRWPTKDPQDSSSTGLNGNIKDTLRQGWDVAYVAGYSHINNWVVARICRKLRIPLLCQSDTNVLNAFDKGRCKLLVKRLIVPRFLNMVSGYLAPGDNGRAYFLHYCNRPDRVFFCPIPVDTDRFVRTVAEAKEQQLAELRTKYGIPTDKKIVVFCAKFVPWKRPLDLVEAVKHLNRDDVVALFIGDGRLRSAIEDAGKDKVIVTGFVNQAVIPLLISMGNLSVMTSSRDNHPLSITESLCLGIPAVLSDKCGCYGPNDVFRDGEDGLLYPCGNIEELAGKIACLLDDEDMWARFSQRGIELAETQSAPAAAEAFVRAAHYAIEHPRYQ